MIDWLLSQKKKAQQRDRVSDYWDMWMDWHGSALVLWVYQIGHSKENNQCEGHQNII